MVARHAVSLAVTLAVGSLLITSCQATQQPLEEEPPVSQGPESPPVSVVEEAVYEFIPEGSAEDNLPFFAQVLEKAGAGAPGSELTTILEALTTAGFDPATISHTAASSKIELPADSISLAVTVKEQCLIGQFSTTWLETQVAPLTPTGCLIGDIVELETE